MPSRNVLLQVVPPRVHAVANRLRSRRWRISYTPYQLISVLVE